ncbi:S9 family peptidase, partial [bacterium]|nr:S9 family peptidase [candidate division CSSED10-310 bacterium]
LVEPRRPGVEYYVAHRDTMLFIITNDEAPNFRIMATPLKFPGREYWREFIPHDENVFIQDIDCFKRFLVVHESVDGVKRMKIKDFYTGEEYYVGFDEPVYTYYFGPNYMFDTTTVRFGYESLITPYSVYDFDTQTRNRTLLKRREVLGGYEPGDYRCERLWATAPDGVNVPLSLVCRTDLYSADGTNPLVLEGYGAYGDFGEPYFSSIRVSLLDRGFVYAIAHVRGGRELGENWYEQGKLMHKKNTFTDFIACAEHLVARNYTSAERMVFTGGSAGGLLMGAVLNMRPDLCGAVVADVPFVDVLDTMLDPSLGATVTEYEEWGDPSDPAAFEYIRSYCPYQNVKAQKYPPILITAGFYDPRVNYWEPVKWAARLRERMTGGGPVLLKTTMAGHGGASGRYDFYREIAFDYAFILWRLGMHT